MRATLIHNARAGNRQVDAGELVAAIERLGWTVVSLVDSSKLGKSAARVGDVVIVAGGDGTVGDAALRFAGTGVPIAVIPTGTVNNVARALGIGLGPRPAIDALPRAVARDVDLGTVSTERVGEERFLEAFGVGVFAYLLAERATEHHKELRNALGLLARELEAYVPHRLKIELDGVDRSGDYLLVSVHNLCSIGPALRLAPHARFDDGELDVVLIRPEDRASLLAHLRRAVTLERDDAELPTFEVHRARQVRLGKSGRWSHVDDRTLELPGTIEVKVEPRAVRFLAPAARGG